LVFCRKIHTALKFWPDRPVSLPTSLREGETYLAGLIAKPTDFVKLCEVKEFYSKICP